MAANASIATTPNTLLRRVANPSGLLRQGRVLLDLSPGNTTQDTPHRWEATQTRKAATASLTILWTVAGGRVTLGSLLFPGFLRVRLQGGKDASTLLPPGSVHLSDPDAVSVRAWRLRQERSCSDGSARRPVAAGRCRASGHAPLSAWRLHQGWDVRGRRQDPHHLRRG